MYQALLVSARIATAAAARPLCSTTGSEPALEAVELARLVCEALRARGSSLPAGWRCS
jgi:hypothetical protein